MRFPPGSVDVSLRCSAARPVCSWPTEHSPKCAILADGKQTVGLELRLTLALAPDVAQTVAHGWVVSCFLARSCARKFESERFFLQSLAVPGRIVFAADLPSVHEIDPRRNGIRFWSGPLLIYRSELSLSPKERSYGPCKKKLRSVRNV